MAGDWDGIELMDDIFIIGAVIVEIISGFKKNEKCDSDDECNGFILSGIVLAFLALAIAVALFFSEIVKFIRKNCECEMIKYWNDNGFKEFIKQYYKGILKFLKAVFTFLTLLFFLIA